MLESCAHEGSLLAGLVHVEQHCTPLALLSGDLQIVRLHGILLGCLPLALEGELDCRQVIFVVLESIDLLGESLTLERQTVCGSSVVGQGSGGMRIVSSGPRIRPCLTHLLLVGLAL